MQKSVLITLDGPSLEALIYDAVDRAIKINASTRTSNLNAIPPYGDFTWLLSVLPIPESTLRQKIAKDEIPGVKKVGKRLVFDKAVVIDWLSMNDRVTASRLDLLSEEEFNTRHQRKGGHKA